MADWGEAHTLNDGENVIEHQGDVMPHHLPVVEIPAAILRALLRARLHGTPEELTGASPADVDAWIRNHPIEPVASGASSNLTIFDYPPGWAHRPSPITFEGQAPNTRHLHELQAARDAFAAAYRYHAARRVAR